jgi:predicted helicase
MKIKRIELLENQQRVKVFVDKIEKTFGEEIFIKLNNMEFFTKVLETNENEMFLICHIAQPHIYVWTTKLYRKEGIYKIGSVNHQTVRDRLKQTDTTGVAEDIELVESFPLFVPNSQTTFKIEREIRSRLNIYKRNREFVKNNWKKEIRPTIVQVLEEYKNTSPYKDIVTPRYYQYYGSIECGKHFEKNNRGWFQWFCRTGKTKAFFWMYEKIFEKKKNIKNNIVVIFVPNLQLVRQTMQELIEIATLYDYKVKSLMIGDDEGMITKISSVAGWINECTLDTLNLVVSTYQSGDVLSTATKITKTTIDLIINDEAHRLAGNDNKSWKRCLQDNFIKRQKTLSATATPIEYTLTSFGFSGFENTMLFGKKFHEYHFLDATFDGVICPLSILGILVNQNEIDYVQRLTEQKMDVIQKNLFDLNSLSIEEVDYEVNINQGHFTFYLLLYHTLCGLRDGLFKHPIIQANREPRLQYFFACLKALAPDFNVKIDYMEYFTSKNSKSKQRQKELNTKFAKSKIGIVGNLYCFQEGITIPQADAVIMIDPRNSGAALVQSASRSLGLDKKNPHKKAVILLPTPFHKENDKKILNPSLWSATRDWFINLCSTDEDMSNFILNDLRFYTPKVKQATEVRNVRPKSNIVRGASGRRRNLDPTEIEIEEVDYDIIKERSILFELISTEDKIGKTKMNDVDKNEYIRRMILTNLTDLYTKIQLSIKNYNHKYIKKYRELIKLPEEIIDELSVNLNIKKEEIEYIRKIKVFKEITIKSKKLRQIMLSEELKTY